MEFVDPDVIRTIRWNTVIAQAGVIGIHLALFMLISMPVSGRYFDHSPWISQMPGSDDALVVRLHAPSFDMHGKAALLPASRPADMPVPALLKADDERHATTTPETERAGRQAMTGAEKSASKSRDTREKTPILEAWPDLSITKPDKKRFTIGRDLTKNALRRRHVRLPGGGHVAGAPRFHMVAPQSQGISGIIHFIGGLAGAVDPHCLKLDSWKGMTTEERLDSGISMQAMENIEDHYNCFAYQKNRHRH